MLARDYMPAVKYGAKWLQTDIAGLLGLPYVGNVYYVDPYAGDDAANDGTVQNAAFKTVAAAFAKCTSGKHDVIVIAPTGGTGRTIEPAAIAWNKRFTHLIGSCAPTGSTPRAGMGFTLAAATTTPQFVLSENGCIFKDVVFSQAVADSYALVKITGDYNYFEGVHFNGIANATAGDSANGYDLYLSGGSENTFVRCTVGNATNARSAANCALKVDTNCSMDKFIGCIFNIWADNVGALLVNFGTTPIDRYILFDHCLFSNGGVNSGGTDLTVAMNSNAAMGGSVIMWDSWFSGGAAVADDFTQFWAIGAMTKNTSAAAGEAIIMA